MASFISTASSTSVSRSGSRHGPHSSSKSISVETLVQHLLDAKRSLSSMGLVLRANELVYSARQAHEEAAILTAQSDFIRQAILDQTLLLNRLRRGITRTYDHGKREFKQILRTLDAADSRLQDTMNVLRDQFVDKSFRPAGEEQKNLLDFIDESQVDGIRNGLKDHIQTLQVGVICVNQTRLIICFMLNNYVLPS